MAHIKRKIRCAIYTRKSHEDGLEQEFNSLHAQREACESYIASQRSEGWVLVRDPSGEHEPAAFLSTDLGAQPATILGWFVSRWRVETTFQEVRAHLGVETQRQWSDLAIQRTTPALLGLFSLITVWADGLVDNPGGQAIRRGDAVRFLPLAALVAR